MQGARGAEAVAVRGYAAHRMHRYGTPARRGMLPSGRIGPGDIEFDRLLERHRGKFNGDPPDGGGGDAGDRLGSLRCIGGIKVTLGKQSKYRRRDPAVRQGEAPGDGGEMPVAPASTGAPSAQHSGRLPASRAKRPCAAVPGACTTSQWALVKRTRYSRSMRSVRSNSCTNASTSAPSVPGRMPIHSSAMAE